MHFKRYINTKTNRHNQVDDAGPRSSCKNMGIFGMIDCSEFKAITTQPIQEKLFTSPSTASLSQGHEKNREASFTKKIMCITG